jgi:hypothetical protein
VPVDEVGRDGDCQLSAELFPREACRFRNGGWGGTVVPLITSTREHSQRIQLANITRERLRVWHQPSAVSRANMHDKFQLN